MRKIHRDEWNKINFSVVVLLVHGALAWSRFGTACPLGHDDLVDTENGGSRVYRVLHSPELHQEQIEDA